MRQPTPKAAAWTLGQGPPKRSSVVQAEAAPEWRAPSMFEAFGAEEAPSSRPAGPPPMPRPSLFEAFSPETEPAGPSWWERLFGAPVAPAPARTPTGPAWEGAPAPWHPARPAMAGNPGPDEGVSWGLAAFVVGTGALLVLELSGVTNIFGTRT